MASNIFFIYCIFSSENNKMHFCQILPISLLKATSSPKFQQWSYFWKYIVHEKKFEIFFFWKFKIFEKIFWKILPNFIQIYRMCAPPLGAWIMKIWAFELKNFGKFLRICLAIFWTEYAINTKNVVCHVFSESRPTYFWLDELNPWLPNLHYLIDGRRKRPSNQKQKIWPFWPNFGQIQQ